MTINIIELSAASVTQLTTPAHLNAAHLNAAHTSSCICLRTIGNVVFYGTASLAYPFPSDIRFHSQLFVCNYEGGKAQVIYVKYEE